MTPSRLLFGGLLPLLACSPPPDETDTDPGDSGPPDTADTGETADSGDSDTGDTAPPAAASCLVGVTATELVRIDPADPAQVTVLGATGVAGGALVGSPLAWDAAAERLYGLLVREETATFTLATFDLATGAATEIAELPYAGWCTFEAFDYDDALDSLIVAVADGYAEYTSSRVFRVGTDGSLGLLLETGFDNDYGAYDSTRDRLLTTDPNGSGTFQALDLTGGGVEKTASPTPSSLGELAYSSAFDALYGVDELDTRLYRFGIEPDGRVAAGTELGATPSARVLGIAFVPAAWCDDRDDDGFPAPVDCDDTDASRSPGVPEGAWCDGVDQDCDGATDEGALDAATWYVDTDGDGFGEDSDANVVACAPGPGYAPRAFDCDPADPERADTCATCATDLAACVSGEGALDAGHYGHQVAAGDFNGDGWRDLAISEQDALYVFFGPVGADLSAAAADAVLAAGPDAAFVGNALVAGDFDGDTLDDLLIGDSQAPSNGVDHAGELSFVSGATILPGAGSLAGAVIARGTHDWERYADALVSVGDVNADGAAEFAVLVDAYNEGTRVEIRSLVDLRATLTEDAALDVYPSPLAAVDTDNDGVVELYVAAGAVIDGARFRVLGFDPRAGGVLTTGDAIRRVADPEDCPASWAIAPFATGDLNQDHFQDVAFVLTGYVKPDWCGGAYLHSQPGRDVVAADAFALIPIGGADAVTPAGDLDGDGYADVVTRDWEGAARLYTGPLVGRLDAPHLTFAIDDDLWGDPAFDVGDLDQDGDTDLVIAGLSEYGPGRVYLVTGGEGFADPDAADPDGDTIPSGSELANLGFEDLDGDQIPNALDPDDDNDGIPTRDEGTDGDGDASNDDTDGDGVPNFLDADDDGDRFPTAYEDADRDGDPKDDDHDGDGTPDYLDSDS